MLTYIKPTAIQIIIQRWKVFDYQQGNTQPFLWPSLKITYVQIPFIKSLIISLIKSPVYVIIFMFCWASFMALYSTFEPLIMWSYHVFPKCPTFALPQLKCCGCIIKMEIRQFVLMILSLGLVIVWVIYRKASWAWILQDFLGMVFSINMLKTLRLPSLKTITILLCTLFLYDIFFVFITPYITKVSFI